MEDVGDCAEHLGADHVECTGRPHELKQASNRIGALLDAALALDG